MINYDKIEDIDCKDIVTENKEEYARLFRHQSFTVKEFCKYYLDDDFPITVWGRNTKLKQKYTEFVLIPYLIRIGALVPSMKDSINYALISKPNIYLRYYEKTCDAKTFSVQKAGEIYFEKDGELVDRSKHVLSNVNVRNMINYFKYIKMCEDCDPKWIEKVEKTLKAYGIISEKQDEDLMV